MDLSWLGWHAIVALLTLTALEIVLGIDNIVFISILSGKLEESKRDRARRLGLAAAMIMRILLLLSITFIMKLKKPLFEIIGHGFSGRDLILLVGGLFLLAKATHEIHNKLEGSDDGEGGGRRHSSMTSVIVQIMLMDIIFSLDSVITAVGMVPQAPGQPAWQPLSIMITAVIISVVVMLVFAGPISRFVENHPTVKMLALSFLVLIGVVLVAEAFHREIPRGYIYFAMAFSLGVELLNLRMRKKRSPVHLHHQPSLPAK
jgi:predicted tellurium resistance membrane protein TerC